MQDKIRKMLARALVRHQEGDVAGAAEGYTRILRLDPGNADALHLLGLVRYREGNGAEAVDYIKKALAILPISPTFLFNLGEIYRKTGRYEEAMACFARAVDIIPDYFEAHVAWGNTLLSLNKTADSLDRFTIAVKLRPDSWNAWTGLGASLRRLGRIDEAVKAFSCALKIEPENPLSHFNLGLCAGDRRDFHAALNHFREARLRDPDSALVNLCLGRTLFNQGDIVQAESCLRAAVDRDGRLDDAQSSLLLCLNHKPDITPRQLYEAHIQWARTRAADITPRTTAFPARQPRERIRIGYVSPDFYNHPVSCFIDPILACHDRTRFEIFCYSDVTIADETTARLKTLAENWRDTRALDCAGFVDAIASDGIDILVDCTGHAGNNRLIAFARKPAPIQVSFLGYPNTTGLDTMDYRITDDIADPPGAESLYTEKLVRMPDAFFCYAPPAAAIEPGALPARTNGYVTFASLHRLARVNTKVVALWSRLLDAVPKSRLLIFRDGLDARTVNRLQNEFRDHGGDIARIDFLNHISAGESFLSVYRHVDIALGTFPWSGHTAACEAIWMGVPTISMLGNRFAGRMVASMLCRIGLEDLVAGDENNYIDIATRLSGNTERLETIRATARTMLFGSCICDGNKYTRALEWHYEMMMNSHAHA